MGGTKNYSYHNPNKKADSSDGGCCSLSCLKLSLYIYNLISLLCGLCLVALSLWLILDQQQVVFVFSFYAVFPYLALGVGALKVFNTVIGCCGISRESSVYLYVYAIFSIFLIFTQLIGGFAAYVTKDDVHTELVHTINTTIVEEYGLENSVTLVLDTMQKELGCCGAQSFEDWKTTDWFLNQDIGNNKVPDSCCKTVSKNCGIRDHPSNIYYTGCGDALFALVSTHIILLGSVATMIAVIQIVGLIIALKLASACKKADQ